MEFGLGVIESKNFDIDNNKNKIIELIKKAAALNIDYLFFGEVVLNGFDGLHWNYEYDKKELKEQLPKAIKEIQNVSNEKKIGCGFGYYELDKENIYDSYLILDKNGEKIFNYRRISSTWKIPNVSNNYKEGNILYTTSLNSIETTVAICGDLWHNDIFERYRKSKAKLIIWPLYIDYSVEKWESNEKYEYFNLIKKLGKDTFIINSIAKGTEKANGGAYFIDKKGNPRHTLPLLTSGIVQFTI